jgi:hypothetical protein
MSLATLAGKFTEVEKQIKGIKTTISELEVLQESKVVGQLTFVVSGVSGDASDIVNLSISPSEANVSLSKLTNLAIGKSTEVQLKSKDIKVGITCTATSSEEVYSAEFDLNDVGDNETLTTEVELASNNNGLLKVQVQATYDTVTQLLESKRIELNEAEGTKVKVLESIKQLKKVIRSKKGKEVEEVQQQTYS